MVCVKKYIPGLIKNKQVLFENFPFKIWYRDIIPKMSTLGVYKCELYLGIIFEKGHFQILPRYIFTHIKLTFCVGYFEL